MARTILVSDVVESAATQLSDADLEHTTVVDLLRYMNDAQMVIAKFLPASCARVDAIRLRPGTEQSIAEIQQADIIPGDGLPAEDVGGMVFTSLVCNMGAAGNQPGLSIRVTDQDALDASDPRWHSKTGAAVSRYIFDPLVPQTFFVTPGVPASPPVWVKAKYIRTPKMIPLDDPIATGQLFSLDDRYVDDILAYALARSFMVDAEVPGAAALASANTQIFVSSINAQSVAMMGVNPNLHHLPLNPAIPATSR